MGFYHPATLVKDAQRHGVEVRPIDVNLSGWKCRWESNDESGRRSRVRDPIAREAPPRCRTPTALCDWACAS